MATATAETLDDRVVRMHGEGVSTREISRKLTEAGPTVSKSAVDRILQRMARKETVPSTEGATEPALAGSHLVIVDPELVESNPFQPRAHKSKQADQELRESIAVDGLIHAPVGRSLEGGRYQLAAGHRRRDAIAELLDAKDPRWPYDGMPLELRQLTDDQMAAIALRENTDREDLTPMEKVRAWRRMIDEIPDMTQERVAQVAGLERSSVSNYLRLLSLPKPVLDLVDEGVLTPRAARELLALQNEHQTADEEIAEVLRRCANPRGETYSRFRADPEPKDGGAAVAHDYRVTNIRELIVRTVGDKRFGARWRPLEKMPGNHGGYYTQAEKRTPEFDVEAFKEKHPASLFHLPSGNGDRSRVWTNEGHKWTGAQTAAARAVTTAQDDAARARGDDPPERATSGSRPQYQEQYERMLGKDLAIKAATPAGVKFNPKHPDPDVMKAAGTRGEPLEIGTRSTSAFRKKVGLYPHHGEQPAYIDDPDECKTCTKGARYAQDYRGAPVEIVCSNKPCWDAKADRGRNAWHRWYVSQCEAWDKSIAERAIAIQQSIAGLPPEHVQDLAHSLLAGREFAFRQLTDASDIELDYNESNLFANESPAYARVRELIGLELPTGNDAHSFRRASRRMSIPGTDETIKQLRGCTLDVQVEATALLVAALSQPKDAG